MKAVYIDSLWKMVSNIDDVMKLLQRLFGRRYNLMYWCWSRIKASVRSSLNVSFCGVNQS